MSVADKSARLQKLRTDAAILQNTQEKEAARAVKGLAMLSEEDVKALTPIVPELPVIVKYTVEDIVNNAHGEVQTIRKVTQVLDEYLEQRLRYYEGQL